jgi:hypothetical protein
VFFTAEKSSYAHKELSGRCQSLAHPGVGLMNDIYVARRDFSEYYLLHALEEDPAAETCDDQMMIYAIHVSPDGTKIGWSETVSSVHDFGEFGEYRIMIADVVAGKPPTFANTTRHNPGNENGWREFGGFVPGTGNRVILGSGDIDVGQPPKFGNAFRHNLVTGKTLDLTNFYPFTWDETIHSNENGSIFAWHSSRGLQGAVGCLMLGIDCDENAKTEYWLMAPFGRKKRRLTYFNEPGYPEYAGTNAVGTNICWQPGYVDRGLVSMMLGTGEQRVYRFVLHEE